MVAAVIAIAVIEIKMYGTTFKGICRLFLDITEIFTQIFTFPLNFISLQIYKLIFLAKFKAFFKIKIIKYSLNIHQIKYL